MFTVKAIRKSTCIACGKETECFEVESQQQRLSGSLCVPDFKRQVKIITAATTLPTSTREPATPPKTSN